MDMDPDDSLEDAFETLGLRRANLPALNSSISFDSVCDDLIKLLETHHVQEDGIQEQLDKFQHFDFKSPVPMTISKVRLLILTLCSHSIEINDIIESNTTAALYLSCCKLLENLIVWQGIRLHGRMLEAARNWFIQALRTKNNQIIFSALTTLEDMFRKDYTNSQKYFNVAINASRQFLNSTQTHMVAYAASSFLYACIHSTDGAKYSTLQQEPVINEVGSRFKRYLMELQLIENADELHWQLKTVRMCLRGLQNAIVLENNYLRSELKILIDIARKYMVFGIATFTPPQELQPTTLPIELNMNTRTEERKGGKALKTKKHKPMSPNENEDAVGRYNFAFNFDERFPPKKQTDAGLVDWNEMDLDSNVISFRDITEGAIRQSALILLRQMLQHLEPAKLFVYWTQLVRDVVSQDSPDLINCLLHERTTQGKILAISALHALLFNSKRYLKAAEISSSYNYNYTSFSEILALSLKTVHNCLFFLLKDKRPRVLTQALKCLSLLVQVTPYAKIDKNLLARVIHNIKPLLDHTDPSVELAAIMTIGETALVPFLRETQIAYTIVPADRSSPAENEYGPFLWNDEHEDTVVISTNKQCWLANACKENLSNFHSNSNNVKYSSVQLKVQTLQLITVLAKNYFKILWPYVDDIGAPLNLCYRDECLDVRLHAAKATEFIGEALIYHVDMIYHEKNVHKLEEAHNKCCKFWYNIFDVVLTLLKDRLSVQFTSSCLRCLGVIDANTFAKHFDYDIQHRFLKALINGIYDKEESIVISAVGSLGTLVQHTDASANKMFVKATISIVLQISQQKSKNVRNKIAWSLANLSFVLYECEKEKKDTSNRQNYIPLMNIALLLGSVDDKPKQSAVRALGRLVCICGPPFTDQQFEVQQATNFLMDCASEDKLAKNRWNACYALGHILEVQGFYNLRETVRRMYECLLNELKDEMNFKVQKSAAWALGCPQTRAQYESYYLPIWEVLLYTLDKVQNASHYYEEQEHKQDLINQIILTLAHLTTMILKEDMSPVESLITDHQSMLRNHIKTMLTLKVPESVSKFMEASNRLESIQKHYSSKKLSSIVDMFVNIFSPILGD